MSYLCIKLGLLIKFLFVASAKHVLALPKGQGSRIVRARQKCHGTLKAMAFLPSLALRNV